jgi:Glycosyl transferase family 2
MPSDTPRIGFVIPAHNASSTIARTLDSLVAQTDARWNAIVIDDGSTDDTADVVRGFNSPQIRACTQANAGPSSARNHGFRISDSALVCFLDADDTLSPEFVGRMIPLTDGASIGASCGYAFVDQCGGILSRIGAMGDLRLDRESMLRLDPPAIMSIVYQRDALDAIVYDGQLFDESLCAYEDWEMLFRLTRGSNLGQPMLRPCDTVLAQYWCESGSLSSDLSRVWCVGGELLKQACTTAEEFEAHRRHWALGILAGAVLAADRVTCQAIEGACDPLNPQRAGAFAQLLRWHAMRRWALPEGSIDTRHKAIGALVHEHFDDPVLAGHIESSLYSSAGDRIEQLVRNAARSVGDGGRIVVYGLGRNADRVLGLLDRLKIEYVLSDDQRGRFADDPRRIDPGSIGSSDVVLVTPIHADSILDRLESIGPARVVALYASTVTISL